MAKRGSGAGGAGNGRAGRKAGRLLSIPEREVQRMHYSEYKKRYSEYYADHYDTETKTIDVIVNPRREAFIKSLPDAYIEHVAQKRLGQDAANWKSKSDKEWLRRHYGSEVLSEKKCKIYTKLLAERLRKSRSEMPRCNIAPWYFYANF